LEELGAASRAMGQTAPTEILQLVISQYDTNGNGTIEFPEYLAMVESQLRSPHAELYKAQLRRTISALRDGVVLPGGDDSDFEGAEGMEAGSEGDD
jgi:hypothetical protein